MGFYNLIVPQFDYCRVIIDLEHDRFQHIKERLDREIERDRANGVQCDDIDVKVLRVPCPPGESVYQLQSWGETSEILATFFASYRPTAITRLDLKAHLPSITMEDMQHLCKVAMDETGLSTIHCFNSKPRKHKKNGGWTGGYGYAVGSPESDTEFKAYKKHGEPSQIEVRVQGKVLSNVITHSQNARREAGVGFLLSFIRARLWHIMLRKMRQAPKTSEIIERICGVPLRTTFLPPSSKIVVDDDRASGNANWYKQKDDSEELGQQELPDSMW